MAEHDSSYKLLFSHGRMVEDLLRGFVKEEWVEQQMGMDEVFGFDQHFLLFGFNVKPLW